MASGPTLGAWLVGVSGVIDGLLTFGNRQGGEYRKGIRHQASEA